MDTGEALYKAICEQPKEDMPRLAYADWLEETGDPWNIQRAEYIRLAIGCEQPPQDASFVAVAQWENNRKRAKELLEQNYTRWTYLKCEMCPKDTVKECKYCGNTRNAFMQKIDRNEMQIELIMMRSVTYHKGFPVGITCRMEEIFGGFPNTLPKIHEWPKSIARRTPILMFKPNEYRSNMIVSNAKGYIRRWVWNELRPDTLSTNTLPSWLFQMVWDLSANYANTIRWETINYGRVVDCESSTQANEILSTVIGNLIRKEVDNERNLARKMNEAFTQKVTGK